jgi:hypothetical protein
MNEQKTFHSRRSFPSLFTSNLPQLAINGRTSGANPALLWEEKASTRMLVRLLIRGEDRSLIPHV